MKSRLGIVAIALAGASAFAPAASATTSHDAGVVVLLHACTRTSTGHCIRSGEFCPQRSYGQTGWDAAGRRYVCKGSRTHPHWEIP